MPPKLKDFLVRWINTIAGVVVASYLIRPGIHWQKPLDLAVAAFLLGILNAFLRPALVILTLPLMLLTLGLFTLVINGLLLWFVGWLLAPSFVVADFKSAFWGALVITLVGFCLNLMTGTSNARIKVQHGVAPPNRRDGGGGNGPVIDV